MEATMAQGDRPSISIADLPRLQEQANRPAPLSVEEVRDYAVAAMMVLRGMSRADKKRVLVRMNKMLV